LYLFAEYWGCDFGWEKNRMDVVKFGGITLIQTNQRREKDLV